LVTGLSPKHGLLAKSGVEEARRELDAHLLLPLMVAREASRTVRPRGTLLYMGCTDHGPPAEGHTLISVLTAALSAMTKTLAYELAPIRVNLIVAGFVDKPSKEGVLGDRLDARREELRTTLPIRRVIRPADVAALALHLMTNTAITGATFDIDGGQRLVEGDRADQPG
jgi:NAD(P)-dependent dehydrogenase (short-subunit alcohol dehydrogenase family)